LLDRVTGGLSIPKGKPHDEHFWALKAISLNVEQGESLGIIGPNGSGKSTLLKLVARIMRPDKGSIGINGSIAPVLELGIGFHPDLTVRENAVIYGVIMGLTRSQLNKHIESIIEFAGLQRFQYAKLRTLSSGMQVRLAFAIAVQSPADVFLVDEALAVGDIEFQQKCLEKFRDLKRQEKSVMLVSHNMDLVKGFCEKTLYLLSGETRALGPTEDVTNRYLEDLRSSGGQARTI
jgi:ABC-type polysaccharide/polyol phosphate transport system ATPase subunit